MVNDPPLPLHSTQPSTSTLSIREDHTPRNQARIHRIQRVLDHPELYLDTDDLSSGRNQPRHLSSLTRTQRIQMVLDQVNQSAGLSHPKVSEQFSHFLDG
jgi:hypothetical protein